MRKSKKKIARRRTKKIPPIDAIIYTVPPFSLVLEDYLEFQGTSLSEAVDVFTTYLKDKDLAPHKAKLKNLIKATKQYQKELSKLKSLCSIEF